MKLSKFQMLDRYIKEFSLNQKERVAPNSKCNMTMKVAYKVMKIENKENKKFVVLELSQNIKVKEKEIEKAVINCITEGVFTVPSNISNDELDDITRNNGIVALSQFARAYICNATALSDMPTIKIPFIDFAEENDKND